MILPCATLYISSFLANSGTYILCSDCTTPTSIHFKTIDCGFSSIIWMRALRFVRSVCKDLLSTRYIIQLQHNNTWIHTMVTLLNLPKIFLGGALAGGNFAPLHLEGNTRTFSHLGFVSVLCLFRFLLI